MYQCRSSSTLQRGASAPDLMALFLIQYHKYISPNHLQWDIRAMLEGFLRKAPAVLFSCDCRAGRVGELSMMLYQSSMPEAGAGSPSRWSRAHPGKPADLLAEITSR